MTGRKNIETGSVLEVGVTVEDDQTGLPPLGADDVVDLAGIVFPKAGKPGVARWLAQNGVPSNNSLPVLVEANRPVLCYLSMVNGVSYLHLRLMVVPPSVELFGE